jgi:hypothetical protein
MTISSICVLAVLARWQIDQETTPSTPVVAETGPATSYTPTLAQPTTHPPGPIPPPKPQRYHGTVILDLRVSDATPEGSRTRLLHISSDSSDHRYA